MAITFTELLAQFEQFLRVERNLATRTRTAYLYDLNRFGAYMIKIHNKRMPALAAIEAEAIRDYLNTLQLDRSYKATTLSRVISSLRAFFDFAVQRGHLQASPTAQLHTPKQPKKLPIYLVAPELVRLLDATDADEPAGLRDRAILTVMALTGTRLSEVTGINLKDLDLTTRCVRVTGKGSKERIIPLNAIVMDAIGNYLKVRAGTDSPALFLNRFGQRMSGRMMENIVRKYALKAGIFKDGISPHKLRHTFATLLHASEVDLIEIQSLMGHANIASTQIYTHTSSAKLRSAVKKLESIGE